VPFKQINERGGVAQRPGLHGPYSISKKPAGRHGKALPHRLPVELPECPILRKDLDTLAIDQ
jgi:hypothetical protein